MKKKYINPDMEIVKLQAVQLLAGSDLDTGGSTEQNLGRESFLDDDF